MFLLFLPLFFFPFFLTTLSIIVCLLFFLHQTLSLSVFVTTIFCFCLSVSPSVSVLEVHQFAQEAVVAESWLSSQEAYLISQELGGSVDEVEQLIRRHEAFRKAAAAWEERFSSLRRLTTVI